MKPFILVLLSMFLSGCISTPQSIDELKGSAYKEHKICLDAHIEKTFELISTRMNQCYGDSSVVTTAINGIFVSSSFKFVVESNFNKSGVSSIGLILNAPGIYGYTGAIQISETTSCNSDVTIFFHNSMWDSHSDDIKQWLNGNLDPCSGNGT